MTHGSFRIKPEMKGTSEKLIGLSAEGARLHFGAAETLRQKDEDCVKRVFLCFLKLPPWVGNFFVIGGLVWKRLTNY